MKRNVFIAAVIAPLFALATWLAGGKSVTAGTTTWSSPNEALPSYVSAAGGRYIADNSYASQTWAFAISDVMANAPTLELEGAPLSASAKSGEAPGGIVVKAGDNLGNGNTALSETAGAVQILGGANATPNSYGGPVLIKAGLGDDRSGFVTIQAGNGETAIQVSPYVTPGSNMLIVAMPIRDTAAAIAFDVAARTLHNTEGTATINAEAGQGLDGAGNPTISWNYERKLYDAAVEACLDWNDRNLIGDQGLGLSVATWTGSAFTVHTRLAIKRPNGTILTLTPTNEPNAGDALRFSGTGCYWGP